MSADLILWIWPFVILGCVIVFGLVMIKLEDRRQDRERKKEAMRHAGIQSPMGMMKKQGQLDRALANRKDQVTDAQNIKAPQRYSITCAAQNHLPAWHRTL